ncbi:hypothetical protein FKB34_03005 [Glycocaulis profundi]|nr:hypothetical protein FKB34_03005 [Glycocaulis profundi]
MIRRHALLPVLAAALVALQAMWPGVAAAAVAAGNEDARWMCATLAPDAETRAHLSELAALAGLDDPFPGEPVDPHDCLACFGAALPALTGSVTGAPVFAIKAAFPLPAAPLTGASAVRGPPVGLRAPPFKA